MDYKTLIKEALKNVGIKATYRRNPNLVIDKIIRTRRTDDNPGWYPTHLFISKDVFHLYSPFIYSTYPDDDEALSNIEGAKRLILALNRKGKAAKVYFIVQDSQDIEFLSKHDTDQDIGLLLEDAKGAMLFHRIIDAFTKDYKLIPAILSYLKDANNLKGPIGEIIRKFAASQLIVPVGDQEIKNIRDFIKDLLCCDDRFELQSEPIHFMASFEALLRESEANIRDHYFHACNTLLIGYMLLDQFYDEFERLAKSYGDDIELEYLWLIIAFYHDIGYPILKLEKLRKLAFESDSELDEDTFYALCVQERQAYWNTDGYQLIIGVLDDLFSHLYKSKRGKWSYDGFKRKSPNTKFRKGLERAFVINRSHGAAGCLRLGLMMNKIMSGLESSEERQFLYRHALIASISILFHDSYVRDCFKNESIKKLTSKSFPFALLLVYIDILQEDRRDMSGSSYWPDILIGFEKKWNRIVAKLNKDNLTSEAKNKLQSELKMALSYFDMNGLKFGVPKELKG